MAKKRLPRLDGKIRSGSWIATSPDGRVMEFFERRNAQKALDAGWKVQTAHDYLVKLN